jgi:hypothetical protein
MRQHSFTIAAPIPSSASFSVTSHPRAVAPIGAATPRRCSAASSTLRWLPPLGRDDEACAEEIGERDPPATCEAMIARHDHHLPDLCDELGLEIRRRRVERRDAHVGETAADGFERGALVAGEHVGANRPSPTTYTMAPAFEALARLTVRFAGRVWLVSKCGPAVEARTRAWLDHHRFFELTGIAPGNLRFCRARPDKAPICKKLGIGFFVDDRWDVLLAMHGVVPHRFLFAATTAPSRDVEAVAGWPAAEAAILAALGSVNPE